MDLGDFETTVKVIVVGNGGVGKSSMTARYCKGVFTDSYKKTIGVDFLEKDIVVDEAGGESVKLMIWDTAGQEEFDALTAGYYRGAGACAIVFSTTDRASFEALDKWKRKVEDEVGPGLPMVLVQNKIDLADSATMTSGEAEAAARRLGLRLYRACVKDNVNVAEVFEYLAAQYILKGGEASGVGAVPAAGDYAAGSAGAGARTSAASAAASERKDDTASARPAVTSLTAAQSEQQQRKEPELSRNESKRMEDQVPQQSATAAAPAPAPAPVVSSTPAAGPPADSGKIKLGAPEPHGRPARKKSGFSLC